MEQILLALSAKKQGGKNTSYTCIRLWRPDAVEFSFAEPLKRMCVDILGLEEWQAFGDDEQKRTPVKHLLWENFPLPAWEQSDGSVYVGCPNNVYWNPKNLVYTVKEHEHTTKEQQYYHDGIELRPKKGPMTAREALQYWGTEIFRKQYDNVWAVACLRKIRKSGCPLAVITDCRFPNEVAAVQQAGGKVIKLTRNPFPEDNHPSEIALDPDRFDQNRFDAILDNATMTMNEQCEALYAIMQRWGIVSPKQVQRMHV